MRIRRFRDEDARKVSHLVCKALREVNSKDYPPEMIEATAKCFRPARIKRMSRNHRTYVVVDGPHVLATGSLSERWILSFFVNPRYHGQGIGTKLLKYLERLAAKAGYDSVSVPSGFTAIGFYRKRGYRKSRDQSKASKDWVILSKKIHEGATPNKRVDLDAEQARGPGGSRPQETRKPFNKSFARSRDWAAQLHRRVFRTA